jgi:hypothetical protein
MGGVVAVERVLRSDSTPGRMTLWMKRCFWAASLAFHSSRVRRMLAHLRRRRVPWWR